MIKSNKGSIHNDFGMVHTTGWDGFARRLGKLVARAAAEAMEEGKKGTPEARCERAYSRLIKPELDGHEERYGCNTRSVRAALRAAVAEAAAGLQKAPVAAPTESLAVTG